MLQCIAIELFLFSIVDVGEEKELLQASNTTESRSVNCIENIK